MGMRIKTNVQSLVVQRHLQENSGALAKSMEKLASGFRINNSQDDPAGLAVSEIMRGKIRSLNQAKRNAGDASSMLQVAEGAMNEMGNIMVRMRELTVQAASDTIGERERTYLNREYTQLAEEIDRIASTTEFNGNKFFVPNENDARDAYTIQVGANHSSPETNTDTISFNLGGLHFASQDLGIGKGAEIGAQVAGEKGPTLPVIAEKLTTLDNAMDRLANERASLGALQSRLSSTINNLAVSVENIDTAKSRIKDADIAEETAELTKNRILVQSNMAVLAQSNQLPEMALALLRP
jgi:flagellin